MRRKVRDGDGTRQERAQSNPDDVPCGTVIEDATGKSHGKWALKNGNII